jgi:hypothetical protein
LHRDPLESEIPVIYEQYTNGRQTLFLQQPLGGGHATADSSEGEKMATPYSTLMIDQGFCFNAGEWNFPDAPLRGLYARNRVYQAVTGMESFVPWLDRLETDDRTLSGRNHETNSPGLVRG